jgi:hypothetical protein
MILGETLIARILQQIRQNFGEDGILACPAGLKSMFIFHSVAAEKALQERY